MRTYHALPELGTDGALYLYHDGERDAFGVVERAGVSFFQRERRLTPSELREVANLAQRWLGGEKLS